MTDPATLQRSGQLQQDLAAQLLELGDAHGARDIELFWGRVHVETISFIRIGSIDGPLTVDTPRAITKIMSEVREITSSEKGGVWISATVAVHDRETIDFDFNWDKRIFLNEADPFVPGRGPRGHEPRDDAWAAEFAAHPRSRDSLPGWAAAFVPQSQDISDARHRAVVGPVVWPASLIGLRDAGGWPAVRDAVDHHVRRTIEGSTDRTFATLVGPTTGARERAIDLLVEDVYDAVYADLFDGRPNRVLIELLATAPLVRPRAANVDLSLLDPDVLISPDGADPAPAAYEVIDSIVDELIRATLVERLQIAR